MAVTVTQTNHIMMSVNAGKKDGLEPDTKNLIQ